MANIKGKQLASNLSVTNVTASGNISASNTSTGSFGLLQGDGSELTGITSGIFQPTGSVQATTNDVEITGSLATLGDLKVSQYIKHIGNENTFINFTTDRIRFKAGNIGFLDLEKDASTPYPATINPGGNRINFRVMDRNTELLLKTDSEAFNVGLFFAGSRKLETTSTGIDVSNINVSASGHITASGNISGSANGTGSFAHITATSKVSGSSVSTGSFGRIEIGEGGIDTAGDITLDGDGGDIILKDGGTEFGRFTNIIGGLTLRTGPGANSAIVFGTGSNPAVIVGGEITTSHNISGSSTTTGSFGKVVIGEMGNQDVTSVSSSISTRLTTAETELGNTLISSSAQIASNISGSFTAASSSFSTRVTTAESELSNTLISSSAQIASNISGSFTAASSSFSTRVTTAESELSNTLISSSAQIASNISGSFTAASSSFSTRVTTAESELSNTLFSSSAQVDHDATTNFVANEHIDHSGVTITAGAGLTGGGTIAATRTLAVGQGTGVTVNANDVAIGQDVATTANVSFASVTTTGNIEAEGDVIAQNYIVSSSVTHMTSSFRSGSTISGDTPADDTHQFTGSLFISGSIPTDITTTNSIFVGNDITASANISASGQVIATGTGSFGSIETTGDVNVAGRLAHTGDADTRILFTDDDINITAGGKNFVDFTEDTVSEVTFNEEGVDIDFRIETTNDTKALYIDAGNDTIQLGTAATTHVTASGNISGSGDIITSGTGSFGHVSSTGVIRTTSIISGSTIQSTGDLTLDSSGDIILDADGTDILLKDGGTSFGSFKRASSDFIIKAETADKDILFKGTDASTTITALQLDMSEGGNAQFLGNISGSQIEASGDVIAFGSSDRRLKDNIQPIENPLEKMDKIGGYTFDWNEKQDAYKGHDVGVIAQEIEEILPELVTTRGTGYKAVKYEKIVPLLIESIKELQKKVEHIEKNCDCLNK